MIRNLDISMCKRKLTKSDIDRDNYKSISCNYFFTVLNKFEELIIGKT